MANRDYYQVLRASPYDDARAIDKAYWKLAHAYHGKLPNSFTAARRLALLNEAYEVLGIPDRRRVYDRERNSRDMRRRRGFFGLFSRLFSWA